MSREGRALTVLAIIVVLALLFSGWRDCAKRGGHYVRGVFFMECLR